MFELRNAQMVKFLEAVLADDLADAVAVRREAGSYWEALEREPVEDGTAWTQIGSKILVADGSPRIFVTRVAGDTEMPEVTAATLNESRNAHADVCARCTTQMILLRQGGSNALKEGTL